jgi:hypothetical protein
MTRELERSVDGRNPYSGRWVGFRPAEPTTKWDLLGDEDRAAYERTPLSQPDGSPVTCPHCNTPMTTEAAFAQHFVITDLRYWNVGDCPRE